MKKINAFGGNIQGTLVANLVVYKIYYTAKGYNTNNTIIHLIYVLPKSKFSVATTISSLGSYKETY
jgi:hypothetical protein